MTGFKSFNCGAEEVFWESLRQQGDQTCPTLFNHMDCNTLGFLPRLYFISLSLLKFMSIELMIQSNHLIVCHPLLLLPSIFPSIWVFYNKSTRVSASALLLSMNIQGWLPLGWTSWISLQSKGLSRVFSNTTIWKHQFFGAQLSLWSNSHIRTWLLEKS